jgi:hypothetical protein
LNTDIRLHAQIVKEGWGIIMKDDLISRQAAIDAIMGQPPEPHYPSWYAEQIKELPSADNEVNLSEKPTSLKLKPCPFCGSMPRVWHWKDSSTVECWCIDHHVQCVAKTLAKAKEAWNRRTKNERTD